MIYGLIMKNMIYELIMKNMIYCLIITKYDLLLNYYKI